MGLTLKGSATKRRSLNVVAGTKSSNCNRCNRKLTAESSSLRGIGPVCAKVILRSIEAKRESNVTEELIADLTVRLDTIIDVMGIEGRYLSGVDQHRQEIAELTTSSSWVDAVQIAYRILGDVYDQTPYTDETQGAVGAMFLAIGAVDEAEAAKKRLAQAARKAMNF